MTLALVPSDNLAGNIVELQTPTRQTVRTRVADLAADQPWDHIVRTMADLPTPAAGLINLTAGSWFFADALDIGTNVIVVPGATECHLKGVWGKFLTGSSTNLIAVNGAAFLETMALSNDAPVLLSGAGGICHMLQCDVYAISACVVVTGGFGFGWLQVDGGRWVRYAGTPAGLYIDDDMNRIQVSGVMGIQLTHFVQYVSGSQVECLLTGNSTSGTNGVTWAAANVPTQGLTLVGNSLGCVTPYNGFTQASARVNCKANLGTAGLLSETAIVP